jgi:hypothetical protein
MKKLCLVFGSMLAASRWVSTARAQGTVFTCQAALMKTTRIVSSVLLLCLLFAGSASGQLRWRISVKLILDASGNPPAAGGGVGSVAEVNNHVAAANAFLERSGRGYQLDLTEIVNLSGVSQWFNTNARDASNKAALEAAAMGNTALYAWRNNAINIYINNSGSGVCSFPGSGNAVFLGNDQAGGTNGFPTLFHESGHFLNLCHTQGCNCGDCAGDGGSCDLGNESDGVADTLRDSTCWTRDQIAQNNFGATYNNLNAGQRNAVDYTYQNLMSYHTATALNNYLLTSDQLDRMTDTSNGSRFNITNGRTRFADRNGSAIFQNGSSVFPYISVANGVSNANNGDIVLLRAGHYNEPMVISKPVTLRATRGEAVVGAP